MSACVYGQSGHMLRVIDGAGVILPIEYWSSFSYQNGEEQVFRPVDNSNTPILDATPSVIGRTESSLAWTIAPLGKHGRATQIPTTTFTITHGASLTYEVKILVANTGYVAPEIVTLSWDAGATAALTDDALAAALDSMRTDLGITDTTANPSDGTVTFAFPAGWSVSTVSVTGGTGTVTAAHAYTGGALLAEISPADIANRSGQWHRLASTTGDNDCAEGVAKTLHVELETASGEILRWPHCTFNASGAVPREQRTWTLTATCPRLTPIVTA